MTKKQGTFLERNLRAHSCAKSLFLQFIERKKKAQCVHFPNFLSRLCTIAPKLFLIGVFSGHYSFLLICTDPKVGFRGARMDIYQAWSLLAFWNTKQKIAAIVSVLIQQKMIMIWKKSSWTWLGRPIPGDPVVSNTPAPSFFSLNSMSENWHSFFNHLRFKNPMKWIYSKNRSHQKQTFSEIYIQWCAN